MKENKTPSSIFIYDAFNGKHTKDKIGYAIDSNLDGRKSEYRRNGWDSFEIISEIPWNDEWFELGDKGKKVFMRETIKGKKVAPDQFLHKLIESLGWGNRWVNFSQKKTSEVFSLTIENTSEFLRSVVLNCIKNNWNFEAVEREYLNNQNTMFFTPRPIQAWADAKYFDMKSNLISGALYVIEDLCPRFGKTTYSLNKFKRLHAQYGVNLFVVASAWLSSHKSFERDHKKFYGSFGHFRFVDWSDPDFSDKVKSYLDQGYPVIVTISIHEAPKKWERQMKIVAKHPAKKKYLFIDEADFASTSKIKIEKIEALANGCDVTRASGTGIKKLAAGFNRIDGIISCSYFEVIAASKNKSKIFTKDYLYSLDTNKNAEEIAFCNEIQDPTGCGLAKYAKAANVVEANFCRVVPRSDYFENLAAYGFSEDDRPTWAKICQFSETHSSSLRYFVGGMFGYGKMARHSLWRMGVNLSHLGVMAFTACSTKVELETLTKVIRSFIGNDFVVGHLCGDTTNNKEADEYAAKLADQVIAEGKKGYLILTMGMGSRSFTVGSLTHILLMYDRGQLDATNQKASRGFSSGFLLNGEIKYSAYVVEMSFDPNRDQAGILDQLILDDTLKNKTENETIEQAFKRRFASHDMVNIWENDDLEIKKIDFAEYWNQINHNIDLIQKVGVASVDVDMLLNDSRAIDIYLRTKGTDNINKEVVPMGKTKIAIGESLSTKKKSKQQKAEEKKILRVIEQARETIHKSPINIAAIYAQIAQYPLISMVNDKNARKQYYEILNFLNTSEVGTSMVRDEIGITPMDIIQLIDSNHLNPSFLDMILISALDTIREERVLN